MKQASTRVTQCIPWNQPQSNPSDILCTKSLVDSFAGNMSEAAVSAECQDSCPPLCEETKHELRSSVLLADPAKECEDKIVMAAALENINLVGDK